MGSRRRTDRNRVAELFDRHAEDVWNHAYRLTGSWELAEDLTAQAFQAAGRRTAEAALLGDHALPWLLALTTRLPRPTAEDGAPAVPAALADLPRADREAAELCLLGELPPARAAEALGTTENDVRSAVDRARARLGRAEEER
ncbi:RNA polymerase subunit sigma-70 [Actinosynnema pretiosum subsp. pretiosum]|uniref:RNA polymerase subunit sigma-70 n=1 Tax=Actinosynnema pretiosum subsp. pretiosum TaxID=103721 RepID=A0AA45R349_9PSEU|nr:RNA polymerase, sigma-24 subunit, ECF subfamily [Actinosynnema pretiosum subsp. pretiosum]QUF03467.1 RNA polymerase subunit sigma-70 [Actinosynnema pretiosum subsp. pretiosum]